MQGGRGNGDPFFGFGDPFGNFGGFGGQGSLMSGLFGGRDPFDDPFFTRPFGGMLQSGPFGPIRSPLMDPHASGFLEHELFHPGRSRGPILEHQPSNPVRSRGPIIEELNSDDEKEASVGGQERNDNPRKHGRSDREPYVLDPDDDAEVSERRSKQLHYRNEFNGLTNPQARPPSQSFTFQSSSVTYGGANGAYYTSSTTKRSGSDGLTFEEHKEANSTTGQAAHRLSRGIHNKGHTVSRKLNSDGKVDTMQTLHNINEDELSVFEEAWKGKAQRHLPGWIGGVGGPEVDVLGSAGNTQNRLPGRGGWALPSTEHSNHRGSMKPGVEQNAGPSHSNHPGRMNADAGKRADPSRGRSAVVHNNKTESRRH